MAKPNTLDGLIHVGLDILATTVSAATKRVTVQTGDVTKESTETDNAELWQHVGFISLPSSPQAGKKAAQAVVCKTSDRDVIIATSDLRGLELQGNMNPGDTCVYAAGVDGTGQARTLWKGNGSISHYTRVGNLPAGAGMLFQIDAENDAIRITNGAGYGIIIDSAGVRIFAGANGALTVGSDGVCSLIGTGQCQVDGSTVVLGSIALPVTNSVCVGPAGIAAAGSSKVYAQL